MSATILALVLGIQLFGLDASAARLGRGDLDLRFGERTRKGVVRTHLGANETTVSVLVLSNRDVLVTGVATAWPNEPSRTAVAVRYRSDGRVDSKFGRQGAVRLRVGLDAYATAFAAAPRGRVMVVDATRDTAIRIRRLLANGRPDRGFGTRGTVIDRPFGDGSVPVVYRGRDTVAVQSDGKILVAASGGVIATWAGPMVVGSVLTRYAPSGALDLTFGAAGRVPLPPFVWPGAGAMTPSIAIDGKGRILLGASAWVGINQAAAWVARFDQLGTPDPTFGAGGTMIEPFGGSVGVSVTGRNEIVLVIRQRERDLIVRLTKDGIRDRTFGADGVLVLPAWSAPVAVDGSGRPYVARSTRSCEIVCGAVEVLAFRRDGAIDRTFNDDGRMRIAMSGPRGAVVSGRWLYVAGNKYDSRRRGDLALARVRL